MRFAHSSLAASAIASAIARAAPFRLASILATLVLACAGASAQGPSDSLYRARAFVTGQGAAERARGFALCLETVLVKLSGDPSLRRDPRVKKLEARAGSLVARFTYHDRMSGIPVHDEQGTRERPFDLTASFDPARTDAALRALGRAPWREPRPALALLLGVRDATAAYVLTGDGARGEGERQSLASAAADRGLVLRLPSKRQSTAEGLGYAGLDRLPATRQRAVAKALDGAALLAGRLVWSEAARGWTARWRLSWRGKEHRWAIVGVAFDDAFRDALDHAAAILSGHGG